MAKENGTTSATKTAAASSSSTTTSTATTATTATPQPNGTNTRRAAIRWRDDDNARWIAVAALFLILMIGFFIAFLDTGSSWAQIDLECGARFKTIQPWQVKTFRPKWFGWIGEPTEITYRSKSRRGRRVMVVDLDKRDIEIRLSIDDKAQDSQVVKAVELDDSIDCGDDVVKCLHLGFSSGLMLVPPGRHTVKAEIFQRNGTFRWGKERTRRVMWMVQECP